MIIVVIMSCVKTLGYDSVKYTQSITTRQYKNHIQTLIRGPACSPRVCMMGFQGVEKSTDWGGGGGL